MEQKPCFSCGFTLSNTFYFCPNCGKKAADSPVSTTIGKQLSIYALSFLLPPMGLWPGIKYLSQKDRKAKTIGAVAIILTVLSFTITLYISFSFVNQIQKSMNDIQTKQIQNIDF